MDASNQMRIHVNADGVVEFSVELTDTVDPSLVATVVAAVRRGIVAPNNKTAATTQTTLSPQPPSLPLPPIPSTEPNAEPTSDPDSAAAAARTCHRKQYNSKQNLSHNDHHNCNSHLCHTRSSSPTVFTAPRNRSVRQIAADIESRPAENIKQRAYSEYDPHREFSSSPAVWVTTRDEFVDANGSISHHSSQKIRHRNDHRHHCDIRYYQHGSKSSHHHSNQPMSHIDDDDDDDDHEDDDEEEDEDEEEMDEQTRRHLERQRPLRITSVKSHPHSVGGNISDRRQSEGSIAQQPTRPRSGSMRSRYRRDRRDSDLALVHPSLTGQLVQHPIRMFSLPDKTRYETVNDMYFGRNDRRITSIKEEVDNNCGVFEPSEQQPVNHLTHIDDVNIEPDLEAQANQRRSTGAMEDGHLVERSNKRREVSVPALGNEYESDLHTHLLTNGSSPHLRNHQYEDDEEDDQDQEKEHAPLAPYMMHRHKDDDMRLDNNWDEVEYEVTAPYRTEPKHSDLDSGKNNSERENRVVGRSAAWRLFSTIGTTFSRRRPELVDDIHQSTLASGGVLPKNTGLSAPSGRSNARKGRSNMFSRANPRIGTVWLEFTSKVSSERLIGEISNISKNMGYQVWRRPGEQKLRCIRQLNQKTEIHVVIILSAASKTSENEGTIVGLRRARSDRNRTESWRYSVFYRELIERLERIGIEIETPND